MNRRKFIQQTAFAGLVLPAFLVEACSDRSATSAVSEVPNQNSFEFNEFTIEQFQEGMSSGKYSSKLITQAYLDRIQRIDKETVKLNSVIEVNPDAIAIAEAMDKERAEGKVRGPLHGIPVLIKDNIDTGDKMMTTAGSLALEGHHASKDAFIIARLREAGAVLLGKTNLSEWANFRSERSSSGWSSRGGQTKNPYITDRNPCGSSSGSGVAAAANLCAIAIGTETNGSIACPSSINGIVGIKPTVGLWSRSGIIPISATQDTAGPMARTVADAATLLGPLTGVDVADDITRNSEGKVHADYRQFLKSDGLKGKRIGVEKSFLKGHEEVDRLLQDAISVMKGQGAEIIEIDFREKVRGISGDEYNVLLYEFKDGLNKYLAGVEVPVKSLVNVIEFNKKNESRAMPFFKQDILEASQAKGDLQSKEYQDALKKILSVTRKAIDEMLQQNNLNAICGPTNGPSWCTDLVNGDHFTGYGMYSSAAIAGYPHISVPMGLAMGLPVGLTFLSTAYSEGELITVGYAYEQASKKRAVPDFRTALSNP
jgi:amidase